MSDREDMARKYAKMIRGWSPAAAMRGERLIEWRRERYRTLLADKGLSEFFGTFVEYATKQTTDDRTRASRAGDAARYRRAYGSSKSVRSR